MADEEGICSATVAGALGHRSVAREARSDRSYEQTHDMLTLMSKSSYDFRTADHDEVSIS
jgi:hypothetical protein